MRQILKKADSLKACADQSKNQEPHVQGKLLVEFTISASGPVTDVVLPSEFVDTLLGRCVVESLKGITFPSAQGADVIYFPLVI